MKTLPFRMLALWGLFLVVLGSCSADTRLVDATPGVGGGALTAGEKPEGKAAMPAALRMAFLRTQQKAAGYDFVSGSDGVLRSTAGSSGATAEVAGTARGVHMSRTDDGGFELGVETTSVGREGSPRSLGIVRQHADGQELVLDRDDEVEERYLAGPLGLEQSYEIGARPEGNGPLEIVVAFDGLQPELADGATDEVLLRDQAGLVRAGYRDLVAVDADGRELTAHMDVHEADVALVIDDADAAYPMRVDPVVWVQQQELTADDGAAGDVFGYSVAVSGGTAVIGAIQHQVGTNISQGAAYVFVQSGTTWTQQAELTADDGAPNDYFGYSVAVSGDIAIVGAEGHAGRQGAAYVFVQSGTTWTQQAELTAGDGVANDRFGYSVAVSRGTAIVGALLHQVEANAQQGAAYVFVQSGTTWTQQAELTASDGASEDAFGLSVAVSGGTAVVGAEGHTVGANADPGAAYVFVQSGTTWTQQAELTAGDGAASDEFGNSVAVSGGTAVVSAARHQVGANADQGAAYVFVQSGTTWTQQAELTAGDGAASDEFGNSVAVSGGTAVVSAAQHQVGANADQGAAYVFVQSGTTWTQQAEVTSSDGAATDEFGFSVAVDGDTAVVSAFGHTVGTDVYQGAAYVFVSGSANGDTCGLGSDCASTFCVDGVCCDTACGGGVATDCQSCLGAMTGGTDGTCGTVQASSNFVCRASTGTCDETGVCDGSSTACPADSSEPDTTPCDDSNPCTQTDTCLGGVCIGTPVSCTPSDQCHLAGTCDPSSGTCSNPVAFGASCNDNNACTQTDTCNASGVCIGGNPVTCPPPDQCHMPGTCDPTSGVCSNANVVDGTSCNDGNACTAADVCSGGICGGTAFTCTPTSCQVSSFCDGNGGCSVVNKAPNAPCPDDGNPCTSDTCDGSGTCAHSTIPDGTICGFGEICVAGSCGAECFIDGLVIPSGTAQPGFACRVCNPALSTTTWSNAADGTGCDDGVACTSGDVCKSGSCIGKPYTCDATSCEASSTCDGIGGCTIVDSAPGTACPDDGNPCTTDTCDARGTCTHPTLGDGTPCGGGEVCKAGSCGAECFIDGVLVPSGTINLLNACQACVPATSTTTWSNRSDGTGCDDGIACTLNDVCTAGICGGTAYTCAASDCEAASVCDGKGGCTITDKTVGIACTDDGNPCTTDVCDGSGACTHPDATDGVTCGVGVVCESGSCGAGCFIDGAVVDSGTINPANDCQVCAPAVSTTDWSNAAEATKCDDGNACTQTDSCAAGVCVGTNPVVCAPQDACHDAPICDKTTGTCAQVNMADGTGCDDGDACTQTDSCQAGVCIGSNTKSCPATDDCHAEGQCVSPTGYCTNPAKPDGSPCALGTCVGGACAPSAGTGGSGGSIAATTSSASTGGEGGTSVASTSSGADSVKGGGCTVDGTDEAPRDISPLLAFGALAMVIGSRRKRRAGS